LKRRKKFDDNNNGGDGGGKNIGFDDFSSVSGDETPPAPNTIQPTKKESQRPVKKTFGMDSGKRQRPD
jgi:hypothetical protein